MERNPYKNQVMFTTDIHNMKLKFLFIPAEEIVYPLSASRTKWSKTLKQFIGCCRRIV